VYDQVKYNCDESLRIREWINERNPAYANFDQKDSGEFIMNLLRFLAGDLNRNLERLTL